MEFWQFCSHTFCAVLFVSFCLSCSCSEDMGFKLVAEQVWQLVLSQYSGNFYKRVSQSCTERTSMAPKWGFSFSGGPHAPVNMADSMEEVNVGGKTQEIACFLCCTVLYFVCQVFANPCEFFGTSIASLDPETVQLLTPTSAMFTGVWSPPEKLNLGLVPHSYMYILHMIVELAYCLLWGVSL